MGAESRFLRGDGRTARLLRNIILIGLGKGGVYLAALFTARLLVEAGGVDAYGLWAPCAQLIMWVGLLDLGFGFALQNRASHASTPEQQLAVAKAAGAVLAVLTALALVLCLAAVLALVHDPGVLRLLYAADLAPELHRPAAWTVAIAIAGLAVSLVAQVPLRLVVGI